MYTVWYMLPTAHHPTPESDLTYVLYQILEDAKKKILEDKLFDLYNELTRKGLN